MKLFKLIIVASMAVGSLHGAGQASRSIRQAGPSTRHTQQHTQRHIEDEMMFASIGNENITQLEEALKKGVNPNALNSLGYPPLTVVLNTFVGANPEKRSRLLTMVDLLIKSGADVNYKNPKSKVTLLMAAISTHSPQLIEKLLKAGAWKTINDKDWMGHIAFRRLRDYGNWDDNVKAIARLLIDYGSDIPEDLLEGQKQFAEQYKKEVAKQIYEAAQEGKKAAGNPLMGLVADYLAGEKDQEVKTEKAEEEAPVASSFVPLRGTESKREHQETGWNEQYADPFVRTESEQTADIARTWGPLYREVSDLIQTGKPANLLKATALIKQHGLKKGYLRNIAENSFEKVQQTREWQELYAALQD